MLGTNDIK